MADRDTIFRLLMQHEGEIRAFVGSMLRDRGLCDDVFQEVALTLWEQGDCYEASRPFGPWARGIAANKVLERRRGDQRFPLAFSPETIEAVAQGFARTEFAARPAAAEPSLAMSVLSGAVLAHAGPGEGGLTLTFDGVAVRSSGGEFFGWCSASPPVPLAARSFSLWISESTGAAVRQSAGQECPAATVLMSVVAGVASTTRPTMRRMSSSDTGGRPPVAAGEKTELTERMLPLPSSLTVVEASSYPP
jgi:hypothetical protein